MLLAAGIFFNGPQYTACLDEAKPWWARTIAGPEFWEYSEKLISDSTAFRASYSGTEGGSSRQIIVKFHSTSAQLSIPQFWALVGMLLVCAQAIAQDAAPGEARSWLNAFDQTRSEQLIQQGRLQMEAGEFDAAERIFLDAMQIAKINFGLDSPEQRVALEYAIGAQFAQGKWEQAESHLSYFEWLNDQVYTRDFFDYLRGTEQLSAMLLRASANVDNPMAVRFLIAAKNLNWRAITAIEATLGDTHLELAPWLYNIVLTHYYQSSLIKRGAMSSYVYQTEDDREYAGWTLSMGDSLRISYRIGKELLERIETIYGQAPDLPAESEALAKVYQADWELLFGNEEDALEKYQLAYGELLESGLDQAQANQVFERPTVLPATSLVSSFGDLADTPTAGPLRFQAWTPNYPATALPSEGLAISENTETEIKALVRFDINPLLPSGLTNNSRVLRLGFNLADMEVISTTPDNEQIRERARYEVSLLQFRPKLEDGAPVPLEDVELEYRFPPQYSNLTLSGN